MSQRRPLDWAWVLGIPIAGLGVVIVGAGLYSLTAEDSDWLIAAFPLAGGLGLTALGAFAMAQSFRENKRTLARNRARQQFPDEPWRWRPEWATGRIVPESGGTTVFELDRLPVPIGGPMRGGVVIPFDDAPIGDVVLTLTATHVYTTRSGRRPTLHRDVVWESSYSVELEGVPRGLRAEVVFGIPPDAPPTNDDHPDNEIIWHLKAAGERAGKAYAATFVVPVF